MVYTYVFNPLKKFFHFLVFLILALVWSHGLHAAEDDGLYTGGAGFAPIDASKAKDPMVPISKSERDEMLQQFKGLVAMGMTAQSYAHWNGQGISDCESSKKNSEAWCHKCQIDMPDASGVYYFYPSSNGGSCTLQQVDVSVHSTDEVVFNDIRSPLQDMWGRGSTTSTGHHWETGQDMADLVLEKTEGSSEPPSVRFIWSRSPLIWNNPNASIRTSALVRATPTPTNKGN